jgi:hypothetical protein
VILMTVALVALLTVPITGGQLASRPASPSFVPSPPETSRAAA